MRQGALLSVVQYHRVQRCGPRSLDRGGICCGVGQSGLEQTRQVPFPDCSQRKSGAFQFGPLWLTSGRVWLNFGQTLPTSTRSTLTDFGPDLVDRRPTSGRVLSSSAQHRSNSSQDWPIPGQLVDLDGIRPGFGRTWTAFAGRGCQLHFFRHRSKSVSPRIWPHLANIRRTSVSGSFRPTSARIRPNRSWPDVGRHGASPPQGGGQVVVAAVPCTYFGPDPAQGAGVARLHDSQALAWRGARTEMRCAHCAGGRATSDSDWATDSDAGR